MVWVGVGWGGLNFLLLLSCAPVSCPSILDPTSLCSFFFQNIVKLISSMPVSLAEKS